MSVTELLEQFSDPQIIQSLSASDKLFAGLVTTVLGMGITFSALIILQFVIAWMDRILNRSKEESGPSAVQMTVMQEPAEIPKEPGAESRDDNELVAVIATVIATTLKTTTDRIIIKNIEKIEDRSPAWNRAGIIEQMNSRL